MSVYRPKHKDKKTGQLIRSRIWWYEFVFAGRLIKESAKTASKTVAKDAVKQRRKELENGFNGLSDSRDERVRSIGDLASSFLEDYKVRQPRSSTFAQHAIGHISRLLGESMAVDIADKTFIKYQRGQADGEGRTQDHQRRDWLFTTFASNSPSGHDQGANEEERLQALKVDKRIGKAYSVEDKADLVKSAKEAPRSKAIYIATMLALHAGMRDKEIRTVQWGRLNLISRIVTVGESKTDAGTGRTIPINDDLFAALLDYTAWYTSRFGTAQPHWYVFRFGRPQPIDPTRPQTSLKTAWRECAGEGGRHGPVP